MSLPLLLLLLPAFLACPPTPNGCYAGTYVSGQHSITNQQCGEDPYRDWCSITYQPNQGVANFGCASNLQPFLGQRRCGLGIDTQGCNTIDTINGPCMLCCCRGGSCNHPAVFMEQARLTYPQHFAPEAIPPPFYDSTSPLSSLLSIAALLVINV